MVVGDEKEHSAAEVSQKLPYWLLKLVILLSTIWRWHVNDKRVVCLWRREGLKVPMKRPKEERLWLNPLGTLLCNALPGSGWIMCPAAPRVSQPCLVL